MKITAEYLRKMGGCEEYQVEVFEEEWPDGARPLLKNLMRCVELGLDLGWFAIECLTVPAWEEYKKVIVLEGRKKTIARAQEEYEKAIASALYTVLKRGKKVLR